MKTLMKEVLSARVPSVMFAPACLLIAGVFMAAKSLADEISRMNDRDFEQLGQPTDGKPVGHG